MTIGSHSGRRGRSPAQRQTPVRLSPRIDALPDLSNQLLCRGSLAILRRLCCSCCVWRCAHCGCEVRVRRTGFIGHRRANTNGNGKLLSSEATGFTDRTSGSSSITRAALASTPRTSVQRAVSVIRRASRRGTRIPAPFGTGSDSA